jgi:hypothetical protein
MLLKTFSVVERSLRAFLLAPKRNTPKANSPDVAAFDPDTVVAIVGDPDVAELVLRARVHQGVVTVDRVAVQIEGDVVGPDDDAVVRTIDEITVERRVDSDRVAAPHRTG